MNKINLALNNIEASKGNDLPSKQVSFCANANNSLEFSPKADTFDKGEKKHAGRLVILGTIAAAGIAVGVDYWKFGGKHCKNIENKISKMFKSKSKEFSKSVKQDKEYLSKIWSDNSNEIEELTQRLESINKIPLEEQRKALDSLLSASNYKVYLSHLKKVEEVAKLLPKDVQKALKENKMMEACEKYSEYVNSKPNVYKPANSGKTFEETLQNVFGTDTKIAKHTYDLEKESKCVIAQSNLSGFHEQITTPSGLVVIPVTEEQKFLTEIINEGQTVWLKPKCITDKNICLRHGILKNNKYGVQLTLPSSSGDSLGNPINIRLLILSPNGKPTPVQKDLLKIAQNPEKLNIDMLQKILTREPVDIKELAKQDIPLNFDKIIGWKNLDYDLLLSAIQSMAK